MSITDDPIIATESSTDDLANDVASDSPSEAVLEELLVEEVSIDGMCGVY